MENKENYVEIDLGKVMRCLWKKAWFIAIVTAAFVLVAFAVTTFVMTPQYRATISMYVNNTIDKDKNMANISTTDLDAAKSLVDTYIVILESDSTMGDIRREAGVDCSVKELRDMISAAAVNETEVFQIEVTGPDSSENGRIARAIGSVLIEKISTIVEGSSVRIVDPVVLQKDPVAPKKVQDMILAALLGIILSCAIVIIRSMRDTRIHDTDDLARNWDIPVLAVIPDLSIHDDAYGRGYGRKESER